MKPIPLSRALVPGLILVLSACGGTGRSAGGRAAAPSSHLSALQLDVSASPAEVGLHDVLYVNLTATNPLDVPIPVAYRCPRAGLAFRLIDSLGTEHPIREPCGAADTGDVIEALGRRSRSIGRSDWPVDVRPGPYQLMVVFETADSGLKGPTVPIRIRPE